MRILDDLGYAGVRCVFSPAPRATVESLVAWGSTWPDGERIAVCEVDLTRTVSGMIDELVASLAKSALAVWPDWYGSSDLFAACDESSLQSVLDRLAGARASLRHRSVLQPWVERAAPRCRRGLPPIVPDFSPTVQIRQLSLALAETVLTLVVRVRHEEEPDSAGLLGFARNLEWLARNVSARVIAVLPQSWSARAELDGISWGSRIDDADAGAAAGADHLRDEPQKTVGPIRGRPHPNSPGEQLMAARLIRDPQLGSLFEYNLPVTTVRGSRYQVDLVWTDGKIAVEIDGYRCHSSQPEFASDRQRDYELQLSGYLVLRLTHDSVMSDVELAIDKIRDFVKLRTGPPLPKGPSA